MYRAPPCIARFLREVATVSILLAAGNGVIDGCPLQLCRQEAIPSFKYSCCHTAYPLTYDDPDFFTPVFVQPDKVRAHNGNEHA